MLRSQIIAQMQLELFACELLTDQEQAVIIASIRNSYWHVRALRKTTHAQYALRRYYFKIADQKKRLQLAGVEKREILDLLRCCRLRCEAHKHPFKPCKYCP